VSASGNEGTDTGHGVLPAARARARTPVALPVLIGMLPLVAVLVAILVFRPYYGVEDDATLLGLVSETGREGFASMWWHHVHADVSTWGMVRPFYWALAYVEYRAGDTNPTVLYLFNWAATGGALLLAGLGLARALRVRRERRGLFLGIYGAAVLAFPWTLDLFAFPSLQEKWVILAAALGFLWFAEPRGNTRPAVWCAVSAIVVVLGALTKAQFLVFLPAYLLLVIDARRREHVPRSRPWFLLGVAAAVTLAVRIVAAHGTYTSQFTLSNIPTQLRSHYFWLLLAFTLVWTGYVLARQLRGADTLLIDLIPLVVFCAFAVVFVQWTGFVFGVVAPVGAAAPALVASRLPDMRLRALALGAALVWALAWISVRSNELYGPLASIGQFARAQVAAASTHGRPVYISCQEGSAAIASYVRRETGAVLTVEPGAGVPWAVAKQTPPPDRFRYALADGHLCPARIDPARWTEVWRSGESQGFVLYVTRR
jgi:hypothetical protein